MERFAKIKNIGTRKRLDVAAICRFCGLQSDEKFLIEQLTEDDVAFKEKVHVLTGIQVAQTDKMPQSVCEMCMDKINDFYEFRLMALNTEKQTRVALGLPPAAKPKPIVEAHAKAVVRLVDIKYSVEDKLLIERALSRKPIKIEDIPSTSKKRTEKPAPTPGPASKKSKKEVSCTICADLNFAYQSDLNDHQMKEHLPLIAKYACGSCRETFEQLSDYKIHENKHTSLKLSYQCYHCCWDFLKLKDFNKHMTNYNCKTKERLDVTVQDIKCFQCKKKFLTQNLFEWHGCFLKTRGNCSKCGEYFAKKKMLFKHYVLCDGRFEAPEAARDPARLKVKAETVNAQPPVKVLKKSFGPKKKIVPPRKMSSMPIVKAELNLDTSLNPLEDDEFVNYDEDITYDNFGNDSDTDDAGEPNAALEPVVQLREQQFTSPAVRIKQERLSDPPAVQQKLTMTAQLIRNIKKEKGANQTAVVTTKPMTQQQKNLWKLKIKAERSGNQSAVTQVLNPLAVGAKQMLPVRKNVFKIPQGLHMKIKLEKKDVGYGVNIEERDEAEPEDEDLLGEAPASPVFIIKQEKLDPVSRKKTKPKQFINPIALMMRDKSLSNGLAEKSLVISAVTSINPSSPPVDLNGADIMMTQSDAKANALGMEETNDAATPRDAGLTMVQIPSECLENEENHSSQLAEHDESLQSRVPEIASETSASEKLNEIQQTNSNDDLEALLKRYEESTPTDNNDLFQELLKFD